MRLAEYSILVIFMLSGALCSCASLPSDETVSDHVLPVDTTRYLVGQLPNGMSYYLVHSKDPVGKADFNFVVKAGSLHERRKEAGAAHFTEHMLLTETEHNPHGYLETFCKRRGIAEGDVNGVTHLLYTEYRIQNVEVANGQNIDSCLQLMYEWAHSVPFNEQTIEYNRSLICSEIALRSLEGKQPQELISEKLRKKLSVNGYPAMGSIRNIKRLKNYHLRRFYERTYVPSNQAIFITGDIDKADVENKIKAIFGTISSKETVQEQALMYIPETKKALTSVHAQCDVPETSIDIIYLTDKGYNSTRNSEEFYIHSHYNELILSILSSRFHKSYYCNKEKNQRIAPIRSKGGRFGNFLENSIIGISLRSKKGEWKEGVRLIAHTLKDIYQKGFRTGEFLYEKQQLTTAALYDRYNMTHSNNDYAKMSQEQFLYNEGLSTDYEVFNPVAQALDSLKKEELDNYFRGIIDKRKPIIAAVMNTDAQDGVPSKREFTKQFEAYWNEDCKLPQPEPNKEQEIVVNCEIKPHDIHIVNNEESQMCYRIITLSNNIKVMVWQMTNSASIYIKGFLRSPFGTHVTEWQDVLPYIANNYPNYMGYGGLSADQIKKWHNKEEWSRDRRIEQKCYVSENSLSVQGKCDYKTFEEYLKSLYLSLTQVSRDSVLLADRKRYCVKESQTSNNAVNSVFNKVVREAKYPHLRGVETGQSHRIAEAFQAATSNFDGLRLFMVGNFFGNNVDSLIIHYLGALPTKPKESAKEATAALPICQLDTVIKQAMPADVAVTFCQYFCDSVPYTGSNHFISELADLVLKDVLNKTMREKLGLLYHPMCEVRLSHTAPMAQLNFWLTTYQQDVSKTIKSLDSLLKSVDQWQIDTNIIRQYKQGLQDNLPFWKQSGEWWCNRFYLASLTGVDADANMLQTIEPITEQEVRNFIKSIVSTDKDIRLTLTKNGKRK